MSAGNGLSERLQTPISTADQGSGAGLVGGWRAVAGSDETSCELMGLPSLVDAQRANDRGRFRRSARPGRGVV